jgi:predicted nucleotidyltransferase
MIRRVEPSTILSRIADAAAEYDGLILTRYSALARAETFSVAQMERIRAHITENPPPASSQVHIMAVAGSLARNEASPESDLDLILITQPAETVALPDEKLVRWRTTLCDALSIKRHNPRGVFAAPVTLAQMSSSAGSEAEPYANVAIRILILLESAWLWNQDNYETLLASIVEKYSEDLQHDARKNFVFLMNDVVRFFRTVCVNYQYTKSETPDGKWPLRNIKLRHSRVMMYFSMIAAIGALSQEHSNQKVDALKILVKMPPLRRLFTIYRLSGDNSFYKVAGFYNVFVDFLEQAKVREELKNLEYGERYNSATFAHLKANSDALCSELFRFFEERRGKWDERFFEYMIV